MNKKKHIIKLKILLFHNAKTLHVFNKKTKNMLVVRKLPQFHKIPSGSRDTHIICGPGPTPPPPHTMNTSSSAVHCSSFSPNWEETVCTCVTFLSLSHIGFDLTYQLVSEDFRHWGLFGMHWCVIFQLNFVFEVVGFAQISFISSCDSGSFEENFASHSSF